MIFQNRVTSVFLGAFGLLLLASCGGGDSAARPLTPDEVEYAPELGVDLGTMERTPSGLLESVLTEGAGEVAREGDSLFVEYTLWLPDGRKMDASADHRPPGPLAMKLGETQLIEGWTQAVTGMRVGERKLVVVPFELAYGAEGVGGRGGIPPYATLIFEMALADLKPGA